MHEDLNDRQKWALGNLREDQWLYAKYEVGGPGAGTYKALVRKGYAEMRETVSTGPQFRLKARGGSN